MPILPPIENRLTILVLVVASTMMAQSGDNSLNSSSVHFKSLEVRLGAPVLKTLTDLSASGFTFQAVPPTDPQSSPTHWIVWPPADNSDNVGHLYARNDIIVGIEHRLSKNETLADVYDALFKSLSEISKNDSPKCSISTFQPNVSNGTLTQISFSCGAITISVSHADFKDQQGKVTQSYEVTETIGVIKK